MTLTEKILKILDLTSVEAIEDKAKFIGAKLEWKSDQEVRIVHDVFKTDEAFHSKHEALSILMNLTVQYLLSERLLELSDKEREKVIDYLETGKSTHSNNKGEYDVDELISCCTCKRDIDTLCETVHTNKYTGAYPLCSESCVVENLIEVALNTKEC